MSQLNAVHAIWAEKNFDWLKNYIKEYGHTLFDILSGNAKNINDVYNGEKAINCKDQIYIGTVPRLRKYIIYIKTDKGLLVLNKPYFTNTYEPMVCGVLNTDKYINHRNKFVINGMTENDVIDFLEELFE